MKVTKWLKNADRVEFNSLHKTYNSKIQCPSTGNVIDNGFLSFYIRAWDNTHCNGYTSEPGGLQRFDLDQFGNTYIPESIREYCRNYKGGDHVGILYCVRHWDRGRKIIHGWILTDYNHNLIKTVYRGGYKSNSVIDEFIKYVAN